MTYKHFKHRYLTVALVVALISLLSSCYNEFDAAAKSGEEVETEYNITIERLHELTASQEYFDVVSDVAIQGAVTANDVGGNLYLTFVIEQNGYGVEILEGINYTYVRYQEGNIVAVNLNGLRLSRSYGVLQVGLASSAGSYYDLSYLGHEYIVDQHITNSGKTEMVTPLKVTLEELYTDTQYEAMCGRLISVEGVRFCSEDYELDEMVWSGSKVFVDDEGRELGCYTSAYAYYSMIEIEEGYATMTGILEYGDVNGSSSPMIKMRTINDYVLDDSDDQDNPDDQEALEVPDGSEDSEDSDSDYTFDTTDDSDEDYTFDISGEADTSVDSDEDYTFDISGEEDTTDDSDEDYTFDISGETDTSDEDYTFSVL